MKELESHQFLPSGSWDGFFLYGSGGGTEHPMPCQLQFANGVVTGAGSDDVGAFSWKGIYDLERMTCSMTKTYGTHTVDYQGHIDENGIWGTWRLSFGGGGFHLWPARPAQSGEEMEVAELMLEMERPH
jgi:hypothetical protein